MSQTERLIGLEARLALPFENRLPDKRLDRAVLPTSIFLPFLGELTADLSRRERGGGGLRKDGWGKQGLRGRVGEAGPLGGLRSRLDGTRPRPEGRLVNSMPAPGMIRPAFATLPLRRSGFVTLSAWSHFRPWQSHWEAQRVESLDAGDTVPVAGPCWPVSSGPAAASLESWSLSGWVRGRDSSIQTAPHSPVLPCWTSLLGVL